MKRWTHCLIVPRSERTALETKEAGGIVPVCIGTEERTVANRRTAAATVTAVIHFRGLTYRCCVDHSDNDEDKDGHVDWAMESIWKSNDGTTIGDGDCIIEEIDEDEVYDDDAVTSDGKNHDKTNPDTETEETIKSSWQPRFHRLHFPIDRPIRFYASSWKGHDSHTLSSALRIYGRNVTHIPLPHVTTLLAQQLLQPLFLFQLFCVVLWSLDEYWMYAIFTLCMLVMFEFTMAYNRWRGVKRLREEVAGGSGADDDNNDDDEEQLMHNTSSPAIECFRNGEWISLPSNQLVVGDIVSLISSSVGPSSQHAIVGHDHEQGTAVPADMLLLSGRAVVNEAMLTGESVPQVKESIGGELSSSSNNSGMSSETILDLSQGHKRSVLFSGTVLMDHHSEEDGSAGGCSSIPTPPNKGLVCFVLRTGFETVQGSLLRSLAYRAEAGGGNSGGGEGVNSTETYIFLALLLLFALISASTVVRHAWGDITRNHFKLILHVIIIITSVIPPELPMELSLAVTTSLSELVKRCQVYCTEPVSVFYAYFCLQILGQTLNQ